MTSTFGKTKKKFHGGTSPLMMMGTQVWVETCSRMQTYDRLAFAPLAERLVFADETNLRGALIYCYWRIVKYSGDNHRSRRAVIYYGQWALTIYAELFRRHGHDLGWAWF